MSINHERMILIDVVVDHVYVYDEPIISEIGTFHAYNRGINDP